MQPPDGPPVWTALTGFPLSDAAADVLDDLAQGDAHGYFDEAGVLDLPREREDLRAAGTARSRMMRTTGIPAG